MLFKYDKVLMQKVKDDLDTHCELRFRDDSCVLQKMAKRGVTLMVTEVI